VFPAWHVEREFGEEGWRVMTATLNGVAKKKTGEQSAEQRAAAGWRRSRDCL